MTKLGKELCDFGDDMFVHELPSTPGAVCFRYRSTGKEIFRINLPWRYPKDLEGLWVLRGAYTRGLADAPAASEDRYQQGFEDAQEAMREALGLDQ